MMDMAAQAPKRPGLSGLLFPQQGQGGTKSPSPKTGGKVPLPSFDDNGEYFPPTSVPVPLPRIDEPPPRNQLWESPLTPEEQAERQADLIKKLRAWRGSANPKALEF